jgi:transcriptional regulator with XRE-family HTH domain
MQANFSHLQIANVSVAGYLSGMTLNIRIRSIRKEKGLTLADLAEQVGVSTPHMSEVERGVKNLNNHLLIRIAEALDVEPSDLITSEESDQLKRLTRQFSRLEPEDQDRVRSFVAALMQSNAGLSQK